MKNETKYNTYGTSYRSHTCGELRAGDAGKKVKLCGWVDRIREHGNVSFVDLRDRYGVTQIVVKGKFEERKESVVQVEGEVKERKEKNNKIKTGEVEVLASSIKILRKAEPLPFDFSGSTEETRLKYRYLDLRRKELQKNFILRSRIVKEIRDFYSERGFVEIETPILAKSTPEGARDYLVPSRVQKGKFYALPQSPQIFKQLIMIAGFDRYYQIAKCFRDEDLRSDRQPEFTQVDVEMSFVDVEDIIQVHEELMRRVFKKVMGIELKEFPRITYKEAMEKYGSDKPDIRFGLELEDVSSLFEKSSFKIFSENVKKGGKVYCIKVPAEFTRKEISEMEEVVKTYGAGGLAFVKFKDGKAEGGISKFLGEKELKSLGIEEGTALFVSDRKHHVCQVSLGHLRNFLGKKLKLYDPSEFKFCWVTEFPLLEYDEEQKRHVAVHHPFTNLMEEDMEKLEAGKYGEVRAKAYDLCLNGVELGGGSIRIHEEEVQKKLFEIMGFSEKEAEEKFGFLMNAFKYGACPHGGIALGLDRMVAILAGTESIRDVIAFPKTKDAESLMDGCPSPVSKEQLDELGISVKK